MEALPADTLALYRTVLQGLVDRDVPFLVGGAYALAHHAGIERHTRDLDLFVQRETLPRVERAASEMCLVAREFSPHWLWKIRTAAGYVDVIYGSGNAATPVDEEWFRKSIEGEVFGVPVRLVPPEEMIWSKAFIQERERFDGADIAHILERRAETLDWQRLMERFGPHWRVLLQHLVVFGFIYPGERHRLPPFVMRELLSRLADDLAPDLGVPAVDAPASDGRRLCGGTLLSRSQYQVDVRERGYRDARLPPSGSMTPADVAAWSRLAEEEAAASLLDSQPPRRAPAYLVAEPRRRRRLS